jgi:exodeoxyribonuclease-3
MKVATWNVNGIRARAPQIVDWIAAEQPDIMCLQEIKASPSQVPMPLCDLENYWCYWHGAKGYSGVGLLFRRNTFQESPKFEHPEFDYETRIVTVTHANIVYASVYVPNGGKDFEAKMRFVESLRLFTKSIHQEGQSLIMCGDMNIARSEMDVHPKERRPRAIGQLPEERAAFENILAQGLVDVGRTLDPNNDQLFTWWAPWRNMRQRNIGWRLDYVLASEKIANTAKSCIVFREIGTSDHAPVLAHFEM